MSPPEDGPAAPVIDSRIEDDVLTVRLNKPDKMNALTMGDLDEIGALLERSARDDAVRCLLLTGAGRAFCAGRDLSEAKEGEDAQALLSTRINPVIEALYHFPKPTVAAVNGAAMGIGLGLSLACDIVYAAEGARFSSPFARLGAALDSGGHYFLPRRMSAGRVLEMIYTGDVIDGAQAHRLGLADHLAPDSVLAAAARDLARRIADGPQAALCAQKALVRRSLEMDLAEVLVEEARTQGALARTADYAEGLAAFRERRPPRFGRMA